MPSGERRRHIGGRKWRDTHNLSWLPAGSICSLIAKIETTTTTPSQLYIGAILPFSPLCNSSSADKRESAQPCRETENRLANKFVPIRPRRQNKQNKKKEKISASPLSCRNGGGDGGGEKLLPKETRTLLGLSRSLQYRGWRRQKLTCSG